MSTNIKSGSWKPIVTLAKRNGTWQYVKKIYVKNSTSWRLVYGVEDARPLTSVDTQVTGTYGFSNPSLTYDNSLGDTSTYGYTTATTGQTVDTINYPDCVPTLVGNPADGYTIFSFDPGYSVLQKEAIINIKYKKSPSVSGSVSGTVLAAISYSTDATNNTGSGTYTSLVSCSSSDSPDATFQTIQTTVTGSLNRQNFKIKVSAKESLFLQITSAGDCGNPPSYNTATKGAGFLISDIYITFR